MLPYLICSFFVYGIWPVVCLKIGLVTKGATMIVHTKKVVEDKKEDDSKKKVDASKTQKGFGAS